LVRHAAKLQKGQTILVPGVVGSVGRAAVRDTKNLRPRTV
jgi:hypothetical protein